MLITACPLCMYNLNKNGNKTAGLLFYRASGRSTWRQRGGGKMRENIQLRKKSMRSAA